MNVPLIDLSALHHPIRDQLVDAFTAVLDSQRFILGPEVESFESEVADLIGVRAVVGVSSGTDALIAALLALDVGPGDEVITTPFTFFATAGAIARVGARPVFVDIDPKSYNIDVEKIPAAISERTRALMPVHLYGQMADIEAIRQLAQDHSLHVIEDAAQALGAERAGVQAGAAGSIGCFSFFPTKNVGAFGDGGAAVTNDLEVAEKLRAIRTHGSRNRKDYPFVGGNFRLDALQAAILRVKLPLLESWNTARQRNAQRYAQLFAEAGLCEPGYIEVPCTEPGASHIYHQYVVRAQDRDGLRSRLGEQGVGSGVYYEAVLHLTECFTDLGYTRGDLPHAELAATHTLALPIHPGLTDPELQRVVSVIRDFYLG